MKRFIEGLDRGQTTLLPDCIDDDVDGNNPARAVYTFADMLDLAALGEFQVQSCFRVPDRRSVNPSPLGDRMPGHRGVEQ
jgi:hypothetical protein